MVEDFIGKSIGAYRIESFIGRGGMAFVYKAFQPAMNRSVAIKILPYDLHSDPLYADLFKKEGQLIASLEHPHILPVYDYGETETYIYIVMRLIERGTLFELTRGVPLTLGRIGDIMAQVGSALDYAHSRHVIHRDIKPHNILIDEHGNCWLADFGISKILAASSGLTSKGIIGTPDYMSPEQGIGKRVDERSDIYSLGVVLYEMVAGRLPFRAETPIATVFQHVYEAPPLPRIVNPKVPGPVEQVIVKALAKNPDDRYANVSAMLQALRGALSDSDSGLEFGPISLTSSTSGFISSFTPSQVAAPGPETVPYPLAQPPTAPPPASAIPAAPTVRPAGQAVPAPAAANVSIRPLENAAPPETESDLVERLVARAKMGPVDYLTDGRQSLQDLRAKEEESSRQRLKHMWEEERRRKAAIEEQKVEQQKQEKLLLIGTLLLVVVVVAVLLAIALSRIP
jgi:serine/threonine-protein kinase